MPEHATTTPSTQPTPAAMSVQAQPVDEALLPAAEIMHMPERPFVQRKCAHCEAEEQVQRRPEIPFIQQKAEESIQRSSCDEDFSGYSGPTCQGSISVGATTISSPIIGYYHLFILYTDSAGRQFYLRGGPDPNAASGYGDVYVQCGLYREGVIEYSPSNVFESVYEGTDACNKLLTMQQRLNEIGGWNVPYVPAGPNSNSVVATLLRAAGLPLRKPSVPTPGFEMEVTSSGGAGIPQHRPTALSLGIAGGEGLLLSLMLQQRLHTFSPVTGGGLPIPIPLNLELGAYGMPTTDSTRRVGGSVGFGTELSLLNLSFLPWLSPLGIQLGAGMHAGAAESPTGFDPELGAYFRSGLYTDIGGRFRIAPSYQHDYFRNLEMGSDTHINSFLLQLGYQF